MTTEDKIVVSKLHGKIGFLNQQLKRVHKQLEDQQCNMTLLIHENTRLMARVEQLYSDHPQTRVMASMAAELARLRATPPPSSHPEH